MDSNYKARVQVVYSSNSTSAMFQAEGLTIDREYIYWTNVNGGSEHGAIHKGFTDPFVSAVPFQTYQINDIETSYAIATNDQFLFFTAGVNELNNDTNVNGTVSEELFMMYKEDASYYYNISSSFFEEPKALITFRNSKLLVADKNKVAVVNAEIFPPN